MILKRQTLFSQIIQGAFRLLSKLSCDVREDSLGTSNFLVGVAGVITPPPPPASWCFKGESNGDAEQTVVGEAGGAQHGSCMVDITDIPL